ncbi:unnamed protein product [Blepharisma stoltei]|uniref:EF-hand domain-containing protein n=1 Tax=Blepharisma stoltei TaxID=1481888 RepID=A0AAU9I957_9CILI|nr:unnamed protein product [Blepharisma stoltei]
MKLRTPLSSKSSSIKHSPKPSQDLQLLQEFMRFSPKATTKDSLIKPNKKLNRLNSDGNIPDIYTSSQAANKILCLDRAKTSRNLSSYQSISYLPEKISKPIPRQKTILLDTLGFTPEKPEHRLPLNLKQLGKYSQKGSMPSSGCCSPTSDLKRFESENYDFGLPASRKDAELLVEWVDVMLSKALQEQNDDPDKLFESTHMIYSTCLNEIIRQVSVQCKERGMLMGKVWNAYQALFEKALSISKSKLELVEERYINDRNRIHRMYGEQVNELEEKVKTLSESVQPLMEELAAKEEIIRTKNLKEEKIGQRVEIIQDHYKEIKKEVLILREENRVLKAKIENTEVVYEEDTNGNLRRRKKTQKKIKPKNEQDIENVLKSDPVLENIQEVNINENIEALSKKIKINEKCERDMFQQDDFKDAETEMPRVDYADKEIMTDVQDLCGDSIGIKKRRAKPSQTLAVDGVSKRDDDVEMFFNQIAKEEDDVLIVVGKDDDPEVHEMKKKHNHIKKLVYTLREEIFEEMNFEDMPHSKLLNLLYKSFNQALKVLSNHPLESLPDTIKESEEITDEEANFKRKQRLLETIIYVEDEKKVIRDTAREALATIKRVIATPVHKLKNVMFKKMLLKLITQFYEDKYKDSEEKEEEFGVYVFQALIKKFIMKKAAENRFNHLLSSCMKYKSIKRVRVFARFIGLYEPYDSEDLKFYLECLNFLNNSLSGKMVSNNESAESIKVPFVRCVECIKHFEKRIPREEINNLKEKIEKFKEQDKQNKNGVIDVDTFLEFLVDLYHANKQDHMNFMRCIYEAADLNEDGYLEKKEFELLLRHVSCVKFSPKLAKQLFDAYCESFSSDEDENVKAISFENLCELNTKHQVFTLESMLKLAEVITQPEADAKLKEVQHDLEDYITEIYWRFSESTVYEDHLEEIHHLVEALRYKMRVYSKPEGVWLGFKILEEESKRVIISQRLRESLPLIGQCILEEELY